MKGALAITMLLAMGADVPAPAELRKTLLNDPDDEKYKLEGTPEEKLEAVKGFIATNLRPTQLMGLHDFIHRIVVEIVPYVREHPEYKEDLGVEEAFERQMAVMGAFKEEEVALEKAIKEKLEEAEDNKREKEEDDNFNLS